MASMGYRTNNQNAETLRLLAEKKGMNINALISAALRQMVESEGMSWVDVPAGRPKKARATDPAK